MKILLYIILISVGLVGLIVGSLYVYLRFFEPSEEAISALAPQGIYDEQVVDYISDYAKDLREGTEFAFAFIQDGDLQFYGARRSSNTLQPVSNDQLVFEIGSITKVMTAYIIHHLATEDKLQLDNSILAYLPITNSQLQDVSIRSLITHTSGLPRIPSNLDIGFANGNDPYKSYRKEDLYDYLHSATIAKNAKGKDEYSNLGYGILGAIAEEVTGQQMADLYSHVLFNPLGMSNSSFHIDDARDLVSPGQMPFGAEAFYWSWDILGSAGAIKSSADQMAYFIQHLLEQGPIAQSMQTKSYEHSEHSSTGLGVFINSKNTDPLYWHNGATGGFNSCMIYSPESNSGLIVLTNRSMTTGLDNKLDAMSFKIFRHLQSKHLK